MHINIHEVLLCIPQYQHITDTLIKTHNITASVIIPHRPSNLNSQGFNNYPCLTYIYISYIILTKIITVTVMEKRWQLTKSVLLYSCNNDITLKMAGYRPEHVDGNAMNKIHNTYWSALVGYLHILDVVFNCRFLVSEKEKHGTKEDEVHKTGRQQSAAS
jgi:hypothetical protein